MGGSSSSEIGGVRVFKVIAGSPAAEAGLEVFFDFILEINGVKMDPSGQQGFAKVIQDAENGTAKLQVFNTRAHTMREVIVNPRKWHGTGLLGATVRYDVVDPAENHGIRVLEVFPNSPAAHAGLMPFQDFLLGTSQAVFHDIDELVEVVTSSLNQRMQVYVYNSDTEQVREVAMAPNNDWGGDGCIGCDIGSGLLHRIPAPRRMPGGVPLTSFPVAAPGVPAPGQQFAPPVGVPQPVYPPGMAPAVPQVPAPVAYPFAPAGLPQAVPAPVMPGTAALHPPGGYAPAPVYAPQAAPAPFIPQMQAPTPGTAPLPVPGAVPLPVPAPAPAPMQAPVAMPQTAPYAQVPMPAMYPGVPAPTLPTPGVPAPAAPAPAALSQADELAALQARIQQLGASSASTVPAAPGGSKWPPQSIPPQVAGVTWPPPAAAPQEEPSAQSPAPGGPPPLPAMGSPGGFEGRQQMASPVTPAANFELPRAPPCTPMNAADAPAPVDLAHALDPAAFAPPGSMY